jgi:hypothetical protein
LASFSVNIYKG